MIRDFPHLLVLGLAALVCACDPAPVVGGSSLVIESPEEGRVFIGDEEQFVDPLTPAVFAKVEAGPRDVTFISESRHLTLLAVTGDALDLAAFIEAEPILRGEFLPVLLRPAPWAKTEVTLLTADRVFRPEVTEAGLEFNVPRGVPLTAIALWKNEVPLRITVESIGLAEDLQGHNLAISPSIPLDGQMPIQILNPPTGWMDAELVYAGLRTGLNVGGGRVGPGRAATIPITRRVDALSLWITATSRAVSDETPRYSIEASVGVERPSIALSWIEEPDVNPRPRSIDESFPLVRDPETWSVNTSSHHEASWFDVRLRGLGLCRPVAWRVIGAPKDTFTLPQVAGVDPLEAPLIRAELASVHTVGLDLSSMLLGPFDETLIATRTPQRARTISRDYYRGALSSCDEESPFAGLYSLYRSDATCTVDGVGTSYLIDRCGHLIELRGVKESMEVCGQFNGESFDSLGRAGLGYTVEEGGTIFLGLGDANVRLVPVKEADPALIPRGILGPWQRYEITEQDFLRLHADNSIPTDDPVRIASGDASGGPWLDVKATGHSEMRTAFMTMEVTAQEDEEGLYLGVIHPGCEERPRFLRVVDMEGLLELHEEVPGASDDEFKIRVYRFWR